MFRYGLCHFCLSLSLSPSHSGGGSSSSSTRPIRALRRGALRRMPGPCATSYPRALSSSAPSPSPRTSACTVSDPGGGATILLFYQNGFSKMDSSETECSWPPHLRRNVFAPQMRGWGTSPLLPRTMTT